LGAELKRKRTKKKTSPTLGGKICQGIENISLAGQGRENAQSPGADSSQILRRAQKTGEKAAMISFFSERAGPLNWPCPTVFLDSLGRASGIQTISPAPGRTILTFFALSQIRKFEPGPPARATPSSGPGWASSRRELASQRYFRR